MTGAVPTLTFLETPGFTTGVMIATGALLALLLAAAAIDLRTRRIPDPLNAAIAAFGLVAVAGLGGDLVAAALGAAVGYGAIWGVNRLFSAWRGVDGIGMGDAKLLAAGGVWIGWAGVPFVLLIGSAAGLAYAAAMRIAGRPISARTALAFGPFLAAGLFAVWLGMHRA